MYMNKNSIVDLLSKFTTDSEKIEFIRNIEIINFHTNLVKEIISNKDSWSKDDLLSVIGNVNLTVGKFIYEYLTSEKLKHIN